MSTADPPPLLSTIEGDYRASVHVGQIKSVFRHITQKDRSLTDVQGTSKAPARRCHGAYCGWQWSD
jgi:hypothetical protein